MIYELRHYVAAPGKEQELLDRFRDSTLYLLAKSGMHVVEFWESAESPGEIWYVVEWPDAATMRTAWDSFKGSKEWLAVKAETENNGPLTKSITSVVLRRSDFFSKGTLS